MTPEQRQLARHALGLDGKRKVSYRNRFFAEPGSKVHFEWTLLAASGMAGFRQYRLSSLTYFWLTEAGARAALLPGEKLDKEDFPPVKTKTCTNTNYRPQRRARV